MSFKPYDKVIDIYRSPTNKENEGVVVCLERRFKQRVNNYRTPDKMRAHCSLVVRFKDGVEFYTLDGSTYVTFKGCYAPRISLFKTDDPILIQLGIMER